MRTHASHKGRNKRFLLRGTYLNVPSPWGTWKANMEVWLNVQVRLDSDDQDDRQCGPGESGDNGSDLLGGHEPELEELLQRIAQRVGDLVEAATPAAAPLERVAQIELFEGLEGRKGT